ncbi:MAG: GIY-YIG nuclease family protein [Puniceicoccaceae bacterium]
MYFIYIVQCKGSRLYVGSCKDLETRFEKHRSGEGAEFTRRFPPEKIVHTETFPTRPEAVRRELQVKRWSEPKKRALINGRTDQLKDLSKSHDHRSETE